MYQFAAAITQKALTAAGQLAQFFSPFPAATHPDGARIFGLLIEVPSSVTADFVVDIKLNGTSIFVDDAHRPTVPGATTKQLIMLDIEPPDTTGVVIADVFDKITVDAITLPTGGLPVGVKIAIIFNDLLNLVAGDIVDGVFDPDRLGTGTRDGSKFLRDDGSWQAAGGGGSSANAAVNALEGWGSSIAGATQASGTNALTKTAANGWGNCGAFGVGAFPVAKCMVLKYLGDPANGVASAISVGITAAASDQSQSYDTADYSFISYTGGWTIYENGTEVYNVNNNTAYSKGEEFEIRMSPDGIVSYWFNGNRVYTSTVVASGTYHADIAMSANGGRVPPIITRAEVQ